MLKILIIEDDIIWQIKLQVMLEEQDFSISLASSIEETKIFLETSVPDVIISDVKLTDGLSFDYFRANPPSMPVIFVTEFADKNFINQTLSIPLASFYIKPFHRLTLIAAIQTAYNSLRKSDVNQNTNKVLKVSGKYGNKVDIPFSKIYWLEVEGNYSTVQTIERKYVQKISFPKLIPDLDSRFIQINKSVIVNKDFISRINLVQDVVSIQDKRFVIGRSFRKKFITNIDKT